MNAFTNPLESLRVASPCTASWDAMAGDDRKRFCGQCSLTVYNLSAMTRAEAEALILGSEGRLCARFYRRADGTVITRDCPVGLRALRRRLALLAGTLATALIGLGAWASTLRRHSAVGPPSQPVSLAELPWREVEPFKTLVDWIDPPPPPSSHPWGGGPAMMGDVSSGPVFGSSPESSE